MKFRFVPRPDMKQVIERKDMVIMVNGGELVAEGEQPHTADTGEIPSLLPANQLSIGSGDGRNLIERAIDEEVGKAVEAEMSQAVEELAEEYRKAIRQVLRECTTVFSATIHEQLASLHTRGGPASV